MEPKSHVTRLMCEFDEGQKPQGRCNMSRSGTFVTRVPNIPGAAQFARHRMLLLLTIAALALAGCSTPGLSPLPDEPQPPPAFDAETVTGCPTPAPPGDLGLEQNDGMAGQGIQDTATLEDTMATDEQAVPTLAEREAMLGRVNQGPARPDARPEGDGPPPVPDLELQSGSAAVDAAAPFSDTAGLASPAATATPCP